MALLHKATLSPTKLELLGAWLPGQPWAGEDAAAPRTIASYRFDDPADEVGLEAFVLEAAGGLLHVPLTYRAARLDGADEHLLGTTEHSVLGTRWVYDGCADPVWVSALARAVLTGGTGADSFLQAEGRLVRRDPSMTVLGSGSPETVVPAVTSVSPRADDPVTVVQAGDLDVLVVRRPGTDLGTDLGTPLVLTGSWAGVDPVTLAGVRQA